MIGEYTVYFYNFLSLLLKGVHPQVEVSLPVAGSVSPRVVFHVEEKWETKAVEGFKDCGWHLVLSIFKDQALFCSFSFCV